MNKKFFVAWLVVFIAWMAGDFVIHGTLLKSDYLQLAKLYRSDAESQQYFHWMLLAHVLMAGAFTWIYSFGREAKPWPAQGVRYGIAVALLAAVPGYLIYYAVQPLSSALVVKQAIFSSVLMVLLGMIVAWFYREPAAA
ncbi:MAG TPA: hypothetical protein VNQ74_12740 [Burkholderiaceae bacterium]|nr:hypothetical protein [Burkholderiaceae bacterium]